MKKIVNFVVDLQTKQSWPTSWLIEATKKHSLHNKNNMLSSFCEITYFCVTLCLTVMNLGQIKKVKYRVVTL